MLLSIDLKSWADKVGIGICRIFLQHSYHRLIFCYFRKSACLLDQGWAGKSHSADTSFYICYYRTSVGAHQEDSPTDRHVCLFSDCSLVVTTSYKSWNRKDSRLDGSPVIGLSSMIEHR